MLRRILIGAVLFSLLLIVAACAGPTSTPSPTQPPSGLITAKWIEPQVAGDTVTIPVSEVEDNWNVHFKVETQDGETTFMAYKYDGQIFVRANICPPCRSIGYSLKGNILVCDTCATTFEAETGDGIEGACVDYPKASVLYEITDGNIVMSEADLIAAYQDTLQPG